MSEDDAGARDQRSARALEAAIRAGPVARAAAPWGETTRSNAERLLGGPIVAIGGLDIDRIESAVGRNDVRITQTTRSGDLVSLQIFTTGEIGENARLETAEVTSDVDARPSTGIVTFGNYVVRVESMVSAEELESLLGRITLAPVSD